MLADLFTWLNQQEWFTAIGTLLGYATLVGVATVLWRAWQTRCKVPYCLRSGQMPVEGTVWQTCCAHAKLDEHEAIRAEHEERDDSEDCVTY